MKITNDKYSKPTWAFALGGIVVVFGLLVVLGLTISRTTDLQKILLKSFAGGPNSCVSTADAIYADCANAAMSMTLQGTRETVLKRCQATYDSAIAKCSSTTTYLPNDNSCAKGPANPSLCSGNSGWSCQNGIWSCQSLETAPKVPVLPNDGSCTLGPANPNLCSGNSAWSCSGGRWSCQSLSTAGGGGAVSTGSCPQEIKSCPTGQVSQCVNGGWVCNNTTKTCPAEMKVCPTGQVSQCINSAWVCNSNTDAVANQQSNTGGTKTGGGGGGGGTANNPNTTSTTGCNPSSPAKVWSCYQETGNCSGCIAYNNGGPKPSKVNSGGGAVTVNVKNPDGTSYSGSGAVRMSATSACTSCNSSCKDPVCNPQREKTLSGGSVKWNDSSKGATYSFTLVGTNFKCSAPAGGSCTITAGEGPTPTPSANDQVNQCWGNETGLGGKCYDCNGDQFINILDFACFAKNWMATIN